MRSLRVLGLTASLLLVALGTSPAHAEEPAPAPEEPAPEEPAPEAAPVAKPPPPVVGWDKGFFIASADGRFKLKLGGRIQFRLGYENSAGDPRGNGLAFYLPRVRFKMKGHLFDKRIKYAFQIDFAKGQVSLKDAFVDLKAHDFAVVRVGQFKTPYSRQFIASSTKQHFVDRFITHKGFAPDRDIGIVLMSDWKRTPLEYAVGLFNGSGDAGSWSGDVLVDLATGEGDVVSAEQSNVPDLPHPMVVARIGVHTPGFTSGYAEGDLKNSPFGLGVGGGIYVDFDADDDDDGAMGGNVDLQLIARGFSLAAALYVQADQDGDEFTDLALSTVGAHASASYAIDGRVGPALGFATIIDLPGGGATHEILGGVSVFAHGHNIKWVLDGGALIEQSGGDTDVDARIRTQFQLDF